MPVNRLFGCLVAASAILIAGVVCGQEDQSRGRFLRELIKKYDADGDGRLSREERTKLREYVRQFTPPQDEQDESDVPAKIDRRKSKLYKVAPGPLDVETVETLTLKDPQRDKELHLRLTYPMPKGEYPVIVFSHGALGSKDAYVPLARHWASHGYVVIQPTHGDSLTLMSTEDKLNIRSIKGLLNGATVGKHWNTRPQDVSFVLDSLEDIEAKVPALAGNIDNSRIGVGGHSYGAHTTQMIGGLKIQIPLTRRWLSYQDPRPQALLMISPPGPGRGAQSREEITRPALVVTGSKDDSPRNGDSYTERLKTYEQLPSGKKYLLFLEGAYHGFGGITGRVRFPSSGPQNPDQVACIQSASLALWDAYLKGSDEAKAFLNSEVMARETDGAAKLTSD